MRRWWHNRRHATCSTCAVEFRKSKVSFPSLVGFSYCSSLCEARRWREWVTQ